MVGMKKPLVFTALDISDPPHLRYSDHMDKLIRDWEDSDHLIIKGVPTLELLVSSISLGKTKGMGGAERYIE